MPTLATNLICKATTQFRNYDFNSYLKVYGKIFGLKSSGLYELAGDSDAGDIRTASVTLSSNTFGILNEKKFPYIYIHLYATVNFRLTYIIDEREIYAQQVVIKKQGLQTLRIPSSRICRGVSWALKLDVPNNGHLRIYSIKGLPITLHAGRSTV